MNVKYCLPNAAHLVHVVFLGEGVKDGVHGVEHGHHLHGRDARADLGERDHVREQDGHQVERLPGKGRFGFKYVILSIFRRYSRHYVE